jgi:hypothetical protein
VSCIRIAVGALGVAGVGIAAFACGSDKPDPKVAPSPDARATGLAKDDQSRCDFRGRADREVSESAGSGSFQPNIRRVFAIVGDGEDRRRILLCREVDTNLDGVKDVVRTYTDKGESLNELADSDYDSRIDTWITFANGRIHKVQLDSNRDGRPDETRYYVRGKLSRIQRDRNHDGEADVWEIYDEGRLQRMGEDLDHDGHVDRWNRDEILSRELARREREEEIRQERADGGAAAPDAGAPTKPGAAAGKPKAK